MTNAARILVVSEGPPPLGDTPAEGGALRAWGLAKGLAAHEFIVTFAYRSTFKMAANAADVALPARLSLATWNGKTLDALLEAHTIIVMRYAMGEAQEITARLKPEHILVSDSYIPISVEVAARRSAHKDENINYLRLQESSAIATRRADYFLYASPTQKLYYLGYFAGLNKLNPTTYDELEGRMFEVPYGVEPGDKPVDYPEKPEAPTLLWYGAFYSWFDLEGLLDALMEVKETVPEFKLLIAGAKNPYNKDPGILAHYEKTMRALEGLGDAVEHIPWHPYRERFATYAKATAIITYNHEGLENLLAWRTRLMDFVLADRPILTNGGDPLGEDLIARGIAFRIDNQSLKDVFLKVLQRSPKKRLYEEAAERYAWANITRPLAEALQSPARMPAVEMLYKPPFTTQLKHEIDKHKYVRVPFVAARYVRHHGVKAALQKTKHVVRGKGA